MGPANDWVMGLQAGYCMIAYVVSVAELTLRCSSCSNRAGDLCAKERLLAPLSVRGGVVECRS